MSATYGLYDFEDKEWLDLGKRFNGGFQVDNEIIIEFINCRQDHTIKLIDDMGNTPDENENWTEIK